MLLLKTKEPTPKSISPGAGVNNAAVILEPYCWRQLCMYGLRVTINVLHGLTMSKLFCLAVASGKGLKVHSQYAYSCAN